MNRSVIGAIVYLVTLLAAAGAGWQARGALCTADMASFQNEISTKAKKQREDTKLIEAKQDDAADQSSQRLDQQQATQQKEIIYVDKQVIQYRDRWRNRDCQRPADWVQLYNASLFGAGAAMPQAGTTGSAPAGSGL